MEVHYKLFVLLSVSCLCGGHLQRLGGFLSEAHQQIHSKVHDVAGAVIGGFGSIIGGPFGHLGHNRPSSNNGGETVLVIVEGTSPDNGGQPQPSYRPHHHPPAAHHEFNLNNPHHHPRPDKPGYNGYNGQRPYQPNYDNKFPGQNQFPNNPYNNENIHGNNGNNYDFNGNQHPDQNQNPGNEYNNGNIPENNGNNYNFNGDKHPGENQSPNNAYNNGNINGNNGNNHNFNSNVNPNQNAQGNPYNPVHNGNEFTNPEQNKPNLDNYKPTETYNEHQHNNGYGTENSDKETNDKTKKPTSEGPLLVPLNDYTYGGEKITINAPKREADKTDEAAAGDDEEFPIDIRFKDE